MGNNLYPVRLRAHVGKNTPGEIAGFTYERAQQLIREGKASFYDVEAAKAKEKEKALELAATQKERDAALAKERTENLASLKALDAPPKDKSIKPGKGSQTK